MEEKIKRIIKTPEGGYIKALDFFPDGEKILFSISMQGKKSGNIYIKNLKNDKKASVFFNGNQHSIIEIFEISISKDGKKILINSILEGYREGGKFILEVEGKKLLPLIVYPKSFNLQWFLAERICYIGKESFIYQKKQGEDKENLLYENPVSFFSISRDFKKILLKERKDNSLKLFSLPDFKHLKSLYEDIISPKWGKDSSSIIYIEKTLKFSSQKLLILDIIEEKREKIFEGGIGRFWVYNKNEIIFTILNPFDGKEKGLFLRTQ